MFKLGMVLLYIAMLSTVFAGETIVDEFNLGTRTAGTPLNGAKCGNSDYVWKATSSVIFAGDAADGYISKSDAPGQMMAQIPVPRIVNVMSVEAKVRPVPAEKRKAAISVGVGNSPFFDANTTNVAWGKGVFLWICGDGTYQCFYNPEKSNNMSAVGIKSGKVDAFDGEHFTTIRLEYDRQQNRVSMWVNESKVVDHFDLATVNFVPEAATIGFSGWGQQSGEKLVDDVRLMFSE